MLEKNGGSVRGREGDAACMRGYGQKGATVGGGEGAV